MSKLHAFINRLGFAIALLCILALSSHPALARDLADDVNALAKRVLPAQSVGIYAVSLNDGKALVDINSGELMSPASCVKMITSAAALSELGVDYRFKTAFLSDTKPNGITVENLYIKGNGDPFITPEALWSMMRAVTNHGIYRITGDVIIDDSFFAGNDYPHKQGSNFYDYEAPTGAVSANFNVVEFIVSPGNAPGSPARIEVDPPAPYIKVINRVKTGNTVRIYVQREVTDEHEIFTLIGETKYGYKPTTVGRSIQRPIRYAGSLFGQLLKLNGVILDGEVRKGTTPARAYPLFEEPSRPLALLVRDMNKFSSNFIAEQLVKHLAVKRSGHAGTTEQGLVAIREWLRSIGIDKDKYILENGSGLSGKSKLSARQLVAVLKAASTDARIGPDFMSSLSILGVDGTLQHWHGASALNGLLRAKTGTLRGTSTLAGLVPNAQGNLIAFTIMAGGLQIGINEARTAELQIVELLAKSH